MKKRARTPQEKKALSYKKDCRNTYGNNDKAARKSIPKNKKMSIRQERRELDKAARDDANGTGYAQTPRSNKRAWKKGSDTPLGEIAPRNKSYRQNEKYRAKIKRREGGEDR